jgi:hypothetical protein
MASLTAPKNTVTNMAIAGQGFGNARPRANVKPE